MDEDMVRELLRRVAQRSEEAFRRLFVEIGPSVKRRARDRLRNDANVEEVVNDTFMVVWKKAALFEGRAGSSVRTWIVGIADNLALMRLREQRRYAGHVDIDELPEAAAAGEVTEGPEDHLHERRRLIALRGCLSALPPIHREVFMLRVLRGLTNVEAAELTGEPEGTIKSRLHTAWKQMQKCLGARGFGGNAVPV